MSHICYNCQEVTRADHCSQTAKKCLKQKKILRNNSEIHPSIYLSIYLSVYQSICIYIHVHIYIYIATTLGTFYFLYFKLCFIFLYLIFVFGAFLLLLFDFLDSLRAVFFLINAIIIPFCYFCICFRFPVSVSTNKPAFTYLKLNFCI